MIITLNSIDNPLGLAGLMMLAERVYRPTGPVAELSFGQPRSAVRARARAPIDGSGDTPDYCARFAVNLHVRGAAPLDLPTVVAILHDAHRRVCPSDKMTGLAREMVSEGVAGRRRHRVALVELTAAQGVEPNRWAEDVWKIARTMIEVTRHTSMEVRFLRNGRAVDARRCRRAKTAAPCDPLARYRQQA